jgi:shikimate kinase
VSIVLLGFRGAGKSTVAHLVSQALGLAVVDLDARLEARLKSSLPDYIEAAGEESFRAEETEELRRGLAETGKKLIVTGGGIVESAAACAVLQNTQCVKILLHCAPEVLWERLKTNPERLRVGKLESLLDLKRLWERRAAKFRSLATFSVDSSDLNSAAAEVTSLIERALS